MPATSVYYDVASSRLDAQMQRIDQLDVKVATAYASGSAILAIFAGLMAITSLPANRAIRIAVLALLALSIGVYVALVVFLFLAYRVSDWSLRPDLATLKRNCASYDEDVMREWVADECILSVQENEQGIANKAYWLYLALVALAGEAALLACVGGLTLVAR